jgi:DNA-binding MarR family transcriptional regulator
LTAERVVELYRLAVERRERARALSDATRLHFALLLNEAGKLNVTDTARLADRDPGLTSRHLARLERAGLAVSRKYHTDRIYTLTPAGARLLREVVWGDDAADHDQAA